ncbi:hypothetical protein FXO38_23119 [Capsicum annuum]|nr:hypothetical protein FXO38_23119 [Capsicum annuum]
MQVGAKENFKFKLDKKRRRFVTCDSSPEFSLRLFPIDQVLAPLEKKILHLYEARCLALLEQVEKLEIGALVFIRGVVCVKILKFEQVRTRRGSSRCFVANLTVNSLRWYDNTPVLDCDNSFIPPLAELVSFATLQPVLSKYSVSNLPKPIVRSLTKQKGNGLRNIRRTNKGNLISSKKHIFSILVSMLNKRETRSLLLHLAPHQIFSTKRGNLTMGIALNGDTDPNSLREESEIAHDSLFKELFWSSKEAVPKPKKKVTSDNYYRMVSEGDTNPNSLREESEIAHDSLFKPPFTLEVQLSENGEFLPSSLFYLSPQAIYKWRRRCFFALFLPLLPSFCLESSHALHIASLLTQLNDTIYFKTFTFVVADDEVAEKYGFEKVYEQFIDE